MKEKEKDRQSGRMGTAVRTMAGRELVVAMFERFGWIGDRRERRSLLSDPECQMIHRETIRGCV